MAHIELKTEDGRRATFATRCWMCGECVNAELHQTKRHKLWILFVEPCRECSVMEMPPPAVRDYDFGSSAAQRALDDKRAAQE